MATPASVVCDHCGAVNQQQARFCRICGRSVQGSAPSLPPSATGLLPSDSLLKQRYRIIASVGKGGMGAVYRAEDSLFGNRPVAVKEMSQSGLKGQEVQAAADAFKREAVILASLQHPYLPSVFDHFEENGRWYLVMSFIEGETLEDRMSRMGKLPLDEVLNIGMQLCDVLNYLHTRQPSIIFRDLKPANIMRTASGNIYLIDFGIARHFKPGQSKDTSHYGSMGYAPPEQYGRTQTNPRSDIYSLGATLYQLVSNYNPSLTPFRFPPLQALVPDAPTALILLLAEMLEIDEDNRPASALSVKQQLQAISSSLAIPAIPVNPSAPTVLVSAAAPVILPAPTSRGAAAMLVSPVAPTQRATKPESIWKFGKKQLLATIISTIGCTLLAEASNALVTRSFILFGFMLAIFLGSTFGPWVATIAAEIAALVSLWPTFSLYPADRVFCVLIALSGFFAGLILFKTRGQYQTFRAIAFATLIGLLEVLLVGSVFYFTFYAPVGIDPGAYFSFIGVLGGLHIILYPVLLLIYRAIIGRTRKSYP